MALYVLQVVCEHCDGVHSTGMVLKLDEGPTAQQSVASFYADRLVPGELSLQKETFRCPLTGEPYSAPPDRVLIVPAPYRL
jgi:hypothetical protein